MGCTSHRTGDDEPIDECPDAARKLQGGMPGPPPADDLTLRILAATNAVRTTGRESLELPFRRKNSAHKVLLVSGSLASVTLLLGGAVFMLGADPGSTREAVPLASIDETTLVKSWPAEPAKSAGGAVLAASVASGELGALEESGWDCPQLDQWGYQRSAAQGFVLAGVPTLMLTFSDGTHSLTVYEQRIKDLPESVRSGVPINIMTGNSVLVDGFSATIANVPVSSSSGNHQLWARAGIPWQAVYTTPKSLYAVTSDIPADQLTTLSTELAAQSYQNSQSAGADLAAASSSDSSTAGSGMWAQLVRGIHRVLNQQ